MSTACSVSKVVGLGDATAASLIREQFDEMKSQAQGQMAKDEMSVCQLQYSLQMRLRDQSHAVEVDLGSEWLGHTFGSPLP